MYRRKKKVINEVCERTDQRTTHEMCVRERLGLKREMKKKMEVDLSSEWLAWKIIRCRGK